MSVLDPTLSPNELRLVHVKPVPQFFKSVTHNWHGYTLYMIQSPRGL